MQQVYYEGQLQLSPVHQDRDLKTQQEGPDLHRKPPSNTIRGDHKGRSVVSLVLQDGRTVGFSTNKNNNIAIFELEKFLSKKVVSVGWGGADCTRWSLRICQVTVCLSSLSALTSFLFQSTSARAGPLLQGDDLLQSGHLDTDRDQQQIGRQ